METRLYRCHPRWVASHLMNNEEDVKCVFNRGRVGVEFSYFRIALRFLCYKFHDTDITVSILFIFKESREFLVEVSLYLQGDSASENAIVTSNNNIPEYTP